MFKLILSRVWVWFKSNWLTVLAIIGAVLLFIHGSNLINSLFGADKSIADKIAQQEERRIKDLAELNGIFQRQQEEQARIQREFETKIRELDERYTEELAKISKSRRQRQKVLENNPTELGTEITNIFGIPIGR